MSEQEKPRGIPLNPAVEKEQLAAAGELAIQQAVQAIRRPQFRRSDLIPHDPHADVLRANQYASGGWLHSPAQLQLFANTDERLTQVAHQLGMMCREVKRVLAYRVPDEKVAYIFPTWDEDPEGIEVRRYGSATWINLITLLGPANLTVETGYRERYEVNLSRPDDAVYPALKLDMRRVLERRKTSDADDEDEKKTKTQANTKKQRS